MSPIVSMNPDDPGQVKAAAELHKCLLPHSPVSRLGYFFMKKFYYTKLVRAGLIRCDLYRENGRYVALSVSTGHPFTFMEEGKKRYWTDLCFVLVVSVLQWPPRALILWSMALRSRNRSHQEDTGKIAEYLTLCVLPEYASVKDSESGLTVSHAMLSKTTAYFKSRGFEEIHLVIEKENRLAFRFYERYGIVAKEAPYIPGHCVLASLPLDGP